MMISVTNRALSAFARRQKCRNIVFLTRAVSVREYLGCDRRTYHQGAKRPQQTRSHAQQQRPAQLEPILAEPKPNSIAKTYGQVMWSINQANPDEALRQFASLVPKGDGDLDRSVPMRYFEGFVRVADTLMADDAIIECIASASKNLSPARQVAFQDHLLLQFLTRIVTEEADPSRFVFAMKFIPIYAYPEWEPSATIVGLELVNSAIIVHGARAEEIALAKIDKIWTNTLNNHENRLDETFDSIANVISMRQESYEAFTMIVKSLRKLRPELSERLVRKTLAKQLQNRSAMSLRSEYWAENIKSMANSVKLESNAPESLVYQAVSSGFESSMESLRKFDKTVPLPEWVYTALLRNAAIEQNNSGYNYIVSEWKRDRAKKSGSAAAEAQEYDAIFLADELIDQANREGTRAAWKQLKTLLSQKSPKFRPVSKAGYPLEMLLGRAALENDFNMALEIYNHWLSLDIQQFPPYFSGSYTNRNFYFLIHKAVERSHFDMAERMVNQAIFHFGLDITAFFLANVVVVWDRVGKPDLIRKMLSPHLPRIHLQSNLVREPIMSALVKIAGNARNLDDLDRVWKCLDATRPTPTEASTYIAALFKCNASKQAFDFIAYHSVNYSLTSFHCKVVRAFVSAVQRKFPDYAQLYFKFASQTDMNERCSSYDPAKSYLNEEELQEFYGDVRLLKEDLERAKILR